MRYAPTIKVAAFAGTLLVMGLGVFIDPVFAQESVTPNLSIDIPNVQFSEPLRQDGLLHISFIGEYLTGIYQFLIGFSITVAIVMLMIGGLQYMLGGGVPAQIQKAKDRMKNAIIGLVLLLSSYVILYTTNPQLTIYQPVTLVGIETQVFPEKTILEEEPETYDQGESEPRPISGDDFDSIFKAFGNCINADWRILKAFAFKESSLNPTVVNKAGFVGLFQTKPPNCRDMLGRHPQWSAQCANLTDPFVNTAAGAMFVQNGLRKIERCEELGQPLSARDAGIILYLTHNSGPGAVNQVLNQHGGCAGGDAIRNGIIRFWNNHRDGRFAGQNLGEKRYDFAVSVSEQIMSLGVRGFTNTSDNGDAACPLQQDPSQYISP